MPDLTESDAVAAAALARAALKVRPAPWNGDQAVFSGADLIVIRSTWDYPAPITRRSEQWLDAPNGDDERVVNPPSLMRWNLSKRYLLGSWRKGRAGLPP